MDPLKPIFNAHDWVLEESREYFLKFRREEDGFFARCEVTASKYQEGDLCTSVSVALAEKCEPAATKDVINRRLGWLMTAAREHFETEIFVKKILSDWFLETGLLSISLGNYWVRHGFMLVAPYELYVASVGISYDVQKGYLDRIVPRMKRLLEFHDDVEWANEFETYERLMAGPNAMIPANVNKPV